MDNDTWDKVNVDIIQNGHAVTTIDENAAYEATASRKHDVFVCNNLEKLNDGSRPAYITIDKNNPKSYNAICVFPIRFKHYNKDTNHYMIFGFLVVDSKNKNRAEIFSEDDGSIIFNILAQEADSMAAICLNSREIRKNLLNHAKDAINRICRSGRKADKEPQKHKIRQED